MRRYASIDFLRGLAMLMMLCLHVIMHVLDIDGLIADMSTVSFFELILLMVLPFMGGLAGYFLMVSSIGNMVSMTRNLEKGISMKDLALRQILGGFLLLIFAMLTEGLIGYQGALGNVFRTQVSLDAWDWSVFFNNWNYEVLYERFWHFETIHTIAWCVILNGVVHAILSRNEKWKDPKKLMKIYVILAVVVLALTPLVWLIGNPYTNPEFFYPDLRTASFLDVVRAFFISPLAGHPEPVFPYLASSFLGSIIGLHITSKKEDTNPKFLAKYARIGFIMFVVGFIGFMANIAAVAIDTNNIDSALGAYQRIWDHRYFVPDNGGISIPYLGWLFQFITLNGFGICTICSIIRLVEYRGKAKKFAEKTKFIRRLGFIAFSIYCFQFLYYIWHRVVGIFFGDPWAHLGWTGTVLVIGLNLLSWHFITLLWEKVGYIGSLEWWIGTLQYLLVPARRAAIKAKGLNKKWYEIGKLDVDGAFYNVEWINVVEADEKYHEIKSESILARKIARWGFFFPPYAFVGYNMAKASFRAEGENFNNKRAKNVGLAAIIFTFAWAIPFLFLSLGTFGLSL